MCVHIRARRSCRSLQFWEQNWQFYFGYVWFKHSARVWKWKPQLLFFFFLFWCHENCVAILVKYTNKHSRQYQGEQKYWNNVCIAQWIHNGIIVTGLGTLAYGYARSQVAVRFSQHFLALCYENLHGLLHTSVLQHKLLWSNLFGWSACQTRSCLDHTKMQFFRKQIFQNSKSWKKKPQTNTKTTWRQKGRKG